MPDQAEHEKPENLVEQPHKKIHSARSLMEEANSNNSLEGYAAMNKPEGEHTAEEIDKLEREAEKKAEG